MNWQKMFICNSTITLNTYLLCKATHIISLFQDLFVLPSEYLYCSPLPPEVYAFKCILYSDEIFHATTYQRVTQKDTL